MTTQETQIKTVRRVTKTSLAINLILSAVKLIGGIWGSSQAVVADAIHSLSDCVTDMAIIVGVRYWSQPADKDHPYGHKRIETVVTVFIGLVLAIVAFGLIYDAILSFTQTARETPGIAALIAAVISIVVKETLYHWTKSVGIKIKSSALIGNAWHQRSDALSSIPAAIAVTASAVDPSFAFLDGIGALIVSMFILYAAWNIAMPAIGQLVDRGADEKDTKRILIVALEEQGVQDVHKIRTRFSGLGLHVDLHVLVDGSLSVRKGHDISESVKARLLDKCQDVVDVIVHIEPND